MNVCFHHGALADSYEAQARKQGLTLSAAAYTDQRLGDAITALYIAGLLTDGEHLKILRRFTKKILLKDLQKYEEE